MMPLEKRPPPEGAVSKGTIPPSAPGSVRYGARFHRFSYSSSIGSNFYVATEMALLRGLSGRGCQSLSFTAVQ